AVVLTLYPSKKDKNITPAVGEKQAGNDFLPVIVFIATGVLDTVIKYVEKNFITPSNHDEYLINTFSVAFLGGFLYFVIQLLSKKIVFQPKALLAGIFIGIPNYFSIWCLMSVLKTYGSISSVIIPVNNMGIVLLSALVAWLFFKEKLSSLNWSGIALAILAILMIALGN
ncbi:MAG: EamA family transporter, partial [Gloeobacteraceae cyanobacterium ES-bin-316]|nr:EamA family transporter [Ferruginibacter sp.]